MTTIFLIRHAEAEGNLFRRAQGHHDGDITSLGRRQIEALAKRFKDIQVDALYSSDLRRAVITASAITKHHPLELKTTPRLREINMGCWEDMTWGELEHSHREQLEHFNHNPEKWEVDGCETFSALSGRIVGAMEDIAAAHPKQTVAVVSHGMAIRTFLSVVSGIPSDQVHRIAHADNTAVALLRAQGGVFRIEYYNDNSHLDQSTSTFARQTWWRDKESGGIQSFRFLPMDLKAEKKLYVKCYADAWLASHGTLEGFKPELYYRQALRHQRANEQAIVKAMKGHAFSGLVELDTERDAADGVGWISLCYLVPEDRGSRLGAQLIGYAVSLYRGMGRKALRLHAVAQNQGALEFYKRHGFSEIGTDNGVISQLLLLEKKIG